MIRLFEKKSTRRQIVSIEKVIDGIEMRFHQSDLFAALHHANLLRYHTEEGMQERFGTRCLKPDFLSCMLKVINGMANKIEEQEAIIKKMQEDAGKNQ